MNEAPVEVGMTPIAPGEFIRDEILDELKLSVSRAAGILRVRRATLPELLNGHAALSPEMALRVQKAFGVNRDTLLSMQAWHGAYAMRQKAMEINVQRFTPQAAPR